MLVIKMLSSSGKIPAQAIISVLTIFLLASCTSSIEQANDKFSEQYGKRVEEINAKRISNYSNNQPSGCRFLWIDCPDNSVSWKNSSQIFDINNIETAGNATIDTSQIKMPKPPEEFSPDMSTFEQRRNIRQLPDDAFEINYSLQNYPASYRRAKLSFDDITIPTQDAFGIKTELGEKNYVLVGNKTLQQNVDFIGQNRDTIDKEVSIDLITEQKEEQRRKYLNLPPKPKKIDSNKNKITDNKDGSESSAPKSYTSTDSQPASKPAPTTSGGLTRERVN